MEKTAIKLFEQKQVRSAWNDEEEKWYFSVIDVVQILTESDRPRKYWSDLKSKLKKEGSELSEKIGQLKMQAPDGKMRKTDCANMENMFRIIQSIPSPKAEPFKQWLAQVGGERIQEMENPELIAERARQYYRELGYSEDWIKKRMQSIEVRGKLTDEWKVQESASSTVEKQVSDCVSAWLLWIRARRQPSAWKLLRICYGQACS